MHCGLTCSHNAVAVLFGFEFKFISTKVGCYFRIQFVCRLVVLTYFGFKKRDLLVEVVSFLSGPITGTFGIVDDLVFVRPSADCG
jgi:hypothetical protein